MMEKIRRLLRPAVRRVRRIVNTWAFYVRYICSSEIVNTDAELARQRLEQMAPPPASSAITHNQIGPMEYDLTIIVPAYNAEKWIDECLQSILSQETEYRYIVKVVNDGSTDRTASLIEQYRNDPHIDIIHQENKGHSGARNAALKHLKSEYVMFVDSDDYLLPGAIQVLLERGYRENADIVEGNGFRFNENGRIDRIKPLEQKSIMGVPWMKVIRSRLFERVEFPLGYLYEDKIIGSLILPKAENVFVLKNEVYAYRIHPDSITQKHTDDLNRLHSYWIMELMDENMRDLEVPITYERYCSAMRQVVFTYRRTALLSEEIRKNLFAVTCGFIENSYAEYFDSKDRFSLLVKALKIRDYGKYCVYCEANIW